MGVIFGDVQRRCLCVGVMALKFEFVGVSALKFECVGVTALKFECLCLSALKFERRLMTRVVLGYETQSSWL